MLKIQLENANLQIQSLSTKINSYNTQAIFKTTTFELVVLQKALEQLEQLKTLLQKRKTSPQNNNQTLPTEESPEIISELKSKISFLEQKNIKLSKENQQLQHHILFPAQSETKEFVREGRKQLFSDPSEIRKINRDSPIRFVNQKGSPNKPYRSPKLTE